LRGGADLPGAVLFACNRNAVRSPMAAAILKHLAGSRVYVGSAGVRAGEPDPFAVAVMEELGIDMSKHRPVTLAGVHDTSFDLIVTLAPEAHHKALQLAEGFAVDVEYWPTRQPRAYPRRLPRRARQPVRQDQGALPADRRPERVACAQTFDSLTHFFTGA
jgi:protein-tyrosine-phosphatase